MYSLVEHRAWLYLSLTTVPVVMATRSLPHLTVVVARSAPQVTVCMFPLDTTLVPHQRVRSAGHLQDTTVESAPPGLLTPSPPHPAFLSAQRTQMPVLALTIRVVFVKAPMTAWGRWRWGCTVTQKWGVSGQFRF